MRPGQLSTPHPHVFRRRRNLKDVRGAVGPVLELGITGVVVRRRAPEPRNECIFTGPVAQPRALRVVETLVKARKLKPVSGAETVVQLTLVIPILSIFQKSREIRSASHVLPRSKKPQVFRDWPIERSLTLPGRALGILLHAPRNVPEKIPRDEIRPRIEALLWGSLGPGASPVVLGPVVERGHHPPFIIVFAVNVRTPMVLSRGAISGTHRAANAV